MVRLDKLIMLSIKAFMEMGLAAGLIVFLGIFVPHTLNGYVLFGFMGGFAFAIPFFIVGTMIGLILGFSLALLSHLFFPAPPSKESDYRFVLASVAALVSWPLAYFGLKAIFEFLSATGETSLDIFSWPVLAAILIGLFVSQRFASRYLKSFSEKIKNDELL
jgi:hypothetical protein